MLPVSECLWERALPPRVFRIVERAQARCKDNEEIFSLKCVDLAICILRYESEVVVGTVWGSYLIRNVRLISKSAGCSVDPNPSCGSKGWVQDTVEASSSVDPNPSCGSDDCSEDMGAVFYHLLYEWRFCNSSFCADREVLLHNINGILHCFLIFITGAFSQCVVLTTIYYLCMFSS